MPDHSHVAVIVVIHRDTTDIGFLPVALVENESLVEPPAARLFLNWTGYTKNEHDTPPVEKMTSS